MLLYLNEMLPIYILANLAAFATAFVLTWMFGTVTKKKPAQNKETIAVSNTLLAQPVEGELIELSAVNDPVFSSGALGPGKAIVPSCGKLLAPCDCEVIMTYPTGHAIGLKTVAGQELLIHIGIDTVQLNGKYFKVHVREGDHVKMHETLIEFDVEGLRSEGYDPTVMVIVTNAGESFDTLAFDWNVA